MTDRTMDQLVGKRINGLAVSKDESLLVFNTDQGDVAFAVEGDCCSQSWFADITGVSALIGGTVTAAETVGMDGYNVEDGRTKQEYDSAYGYKLTTDKGYADVVFRNSSNGGEMFLIDGAYRDKRIAGEMLTPITDDWRA